MWYLWQGQSLCCQKSAARCLFPPRRIALARRFGRSGFRAFFGVFHRIGNRAGGVSAVTQIVALPVASREGDEQSQCK